MAASDLRSHKVVKKTRERKLSKTLDKELISQAIDGDQESQLDSEAKRSDKKSQGIVIDGKTYTCATCKAGHRVGVCKHGRERPMKATHPPGRPPAGAPKKVVCDCPKSCNCVKKDCKCARRCNCIQAMYMLVYIPAPGEDENPEDEKGSWKLGEQVMTDLKGNILTPEQVKERKEKKDALKTLLPFDPRNVNGPILASEKVTDTRNPIATSQSGSDDCCKHKENVSSRNIAAHASPVSGVVSKSSAEGCNCGHACNCAFCPQHPNNSTSLNVARQQAVHFASHPQVDSQSIVPFLPTFPQNGSCMGGQPRFAMSRHAGRPSFKQLQTLFPNPGYVIGYPVWPLRHDQTAMDMASFTNGGEHTFTETIPIPSTDASSLTYSVLPIESTPAPTGFPFSEDDYGIGDAFVASAGAEGWNHDTFNSEDWNFDDTTTTTPFGQPHGQTDGTTPFHNIPSELASTAPTQITTPFNPMSGTDTHQFMESSERIHASMPMDTILPGHSGSFQSHSCCQPVDRPDSTFGSDLSKLECYSPSLANNSDHRFGGMV